MDIIRLLPDAIANQIAAGEVIQRPASVLKELVENAIDAGSTEITIIINEAGKTLIQVIDNGAGMSETDARMCFERHATSKIQEAKDLFSIQTKGFRGEAMASIAAVAQVELKTRRAEDDLATRILIANSQVDKQEYIQAPQGTSVAVKNLFFNVPARRNFLKSNPVELRHIIDEFHRLALAHHDIHFRFYNNKSEIYHLKPSNLRRRVVAVFGKHINEKLIPVNESTDVVRVKGFVSKPDYSKKTRGEQYFFVNDRFIKSNYFNHAVRTVYDEILPEKHYPLYVLFLTIDPAQIDINVHPTKQEIKFQQSSIIYNIIKASVKHALGQIHAVSTLDFSRDPGLERMTEQSGFNQQSTIPPLDATSWRNMYDGLENIQAPIIPSGSPLSGETDTDTDSSLFQDGWPSAERPLQVANSFIFVPSKNGFTLIDQRAAHERILYERYLEQLESGECSIQKELFPVTIELSAGDSALLKEIMPSVQLLGFDIQEFGGHTFVIHGIPSHLSGEINHLDTIQELLEQFKERTKLRLEPKELMAAAMAISTAFRRGKKLSKEEMETIINQLFATTMPYNSPTGRKCFITFEKSKLDRLFSS